MVGKNLKMPVVFIGHGSPMNAIEDNEFAKGWQGIAAKTPRPKAILCISAHWYGEGTFVTSAITPGLIYDFYGFPEELYGKQYPAKGAPALALRVKEAVKSVKVRLDEIRGLDHGTWVVLYRMYPEADIPVIQLSIDGNLSPKEQFKIGQELSVLRDEGVLILGSGNIVHNLSLVDYDANPYDWAKEFDGFVSKSLEQKDTKALFEWKQNKNGKLANPFEDHFVPLFYVLGASGGETPRFSVENIFAGSLSMRCAVFGGLDG